MSKLSKMFRYRRRHKLYSTASSSSSSSSSPTRTTTTVAVASMETQIFTVSTILLISLYLLQLITQHQTLAKSSTIDLTTEFALLSKTSAITSRSIKHKLLAPNLTPPASSGSSSFSSSLSLPSSSSSSSSSFSSSTTTRRSNEQAEPQHTLVSLSSKSYISAPTTSTTPTPTIAKLAKRAGTLADLKQKKFLKDGQKNRTHEIEGRHKQPLNDASDHIPDSSGPIPYRIGRPLIPPPDYGTTGAHGSISSSSSGSSGYHAVPFEAEKWRNDYWEREYNKNPEQNSTRVQHIEAECQDDYMKIRVGFNGSFSGLVYSAGYAYDPDCMYINGSGRDYYEFFIQLNRCGTLGKNALHDESRKNPTNFMWNTVTVQYNALIEEEYDEHFKVTCEYGYDFWKTVTFPFLDVEVATGNPVVFTLSPPECYMEIQNGYGIGGPRVTGPVRVGDPLTLIIYMRSKYDGFDIVVNDCYAHNGANKRIQLIDEYGCPVDDKLISRFRGSWSDTGVFETQVYAYMKTFRFTGSPALYIECDVRMCHGRCPSQPCHWRNLKAVTKRDISNVSAAALSREERDSEAAPLLISDSTLSTTAPPLSENVNLFQSLRVLQEGESDGDGDGGDNVAGSNTQAIRRLHDSNFANQTCLKTTTFSALTATFSVVLCIISAALMIACARLKQRSKEASLYDTYITHKGQID